MSISPSNPPVAGTVVIGLGNPLVGDDGLGLAALEQLRSRGTARDVELVDGGTWGLSLLPVIESAARVLLLDAIDAGGSPGTLHILRRADLPRYLATRISPHEVDLQDVLALAELRGTLPHETVAIGLQPGRVETGCDLSDAVRNRLGELVDAVEHQLAAWRADPSSAIPSLHA
ncbi:MAG TPA: HyaD/HybD family hydrogenase maturation endopeptidase [Gemmatimonadales bacterium]|nr:HyaD/HybD family hydrogenase maturation endopeptidase [Gemmatimonadales bacterium]